MYKAERGMEGDYYIMHGDCAKLSFTREEADAIVNLLNRKLQHNSRDRRALLRKMAPAMNIPRKGK